MAASSHEPPGRDNDHKAYRGRLVSPPCRILPLSPYKENAMSETDIDYPRLRQIMVDGLTVLGLVVLLAFELPL